MQVDYNNLYAAAAIIYPRIKFFLFIYKCHKNN